MAFTPEQQAEIIEAIGRRALPIAQGLCPACQTSNGFTLSPGFAFLALQDTTQTMKWTGTGMPTVALVCGHCGHTLLFNLLTLGLDWATGGS